MSSDHLTNEILQDLLYESYNSASNNDTLIKVTIDGIATIADMAIAEVDFI
ncbi:8632_t:CDS:2 [Cetraspora pellucida]|uniref:8632_t:CDS:1 n=1 Tax=Cetraspora pellucida TaxID=1433469 RepID=A0ACA9K3Z7_9GLOM|nr:8632_t:CDS:2 [Cetraspora pellucida]